MTYQLSKSKILSGLQCPKRLYLEVHRPELAQVSESAPRHLNVPQNEAAGCLRYRGKSTEVRDLLGHTTVTMMERYAHLAPENVRAGVNRLDAESRFGHVGETEKETAVQEAR